MNLISTLREKLVRLDEKKVLIAQLGDSKESQDNYTLLNCDGYGRVRVYKNFTIHATHSSDLDTRKPLYRGHTPVEEMRTQVFQLAGCNWRCWYCFVDYNLLSGNPKYGKFLSANEMLDMYLEQENPPQIFDLSGGQPDLVPEWCLWMMQAIEERGLKDKVYVWLDDNLGTDVLWNVLSPEDILYMSQFPKHSRTCCFKGFDQESFAFNTGQKNASFDSQFTIFDRLLRSGFDLYAYATLTTQGTCTKEKMQLFVDRLQAIHPNVPLRTIPLEIKPFTNTTSRMNSTKLQDLFVEQQKAYDFWWDELTKRFTQSELMLPYDKVSLS